MQSLFSKIKRQWRSCFCAFLFVANFVGTAFAQLPPPRIYLNQLPAEEVPGAAMLASKFDETVRAELQRSLNVETTADAAIRRARSGETDPRVLEGDLSRVAGKEAFQAGKYEEALPHLKAALIHYEESMRMLRTFNVVPETLNLLGAVSFELQYDGDAHSYFSRAIALDPNAQVPDFLSESAAAFYKSEKSKLLAKRRGSLRIETIPPGAQVWVDGEKIGESPITATKLVSGSHYVQAQFGTQTAAESVEIAQTKRTNLKKLTLDDELLSAEPNPILVTTLVEHARRGDFGENYRNQCEQVSRETSANYVAIGHILAGERDFVLRSYLYGIAQKQLVALTEYRFKADLASVSVKASAFAQELEQAMLNFPGDRQLILDLAPLVLPPVDAPAPVPTTQKPNSSFIGHSEPVALPGTEAPSPAKSKEKKNSPWYTKWWFWSGVATVVVTGVGVGSYFLLKDEISSKKLNAEVTW